MAYKPKEQFPGDTVYNRDLGFNEPFGRAEQGVEGPQGERGELIPGRPPGNIGVPLPVNPSVVTDDTDRKEKIPKVYRGAASISPIPEQKKPFDEKLLLQIPHDLKERYEDLSKRVYQYARAVNLDSLDAYEYKISPPPEWVDEEMKNVQIDWDDHTSWKSYLNSVKHEDFDTWMGPQNMEQIAPTLHSQFSVEAADGDFKKWFLETKPSLTQDKSLVTFARETARNSSDSGLGKSYIEYWKNRNLGKSRGQAYNFAKERWLKQVRENGVNHVMEKYKSPLETATKAREGFVPINDLLSALKELPLPDQDDIASYREEFDNLIGEGMHALDYSREPTSRDDRLFGDLVHEGIRWIPLSRIEGNVKSVPSTINISAAHYVNTNPIFVYRYGSLYFLANEEDADIDSLNISRSLGISYVQADVTNIVPGSSIKKRYAFTPEEFNKKSSFLAEAIKEIESGEDKEAIFMKYGREYGPGLRKSIGDYFYVKSFAKESDAGSCDNTSGGNSCSTFWNDQSSDNCAGCTFNAGSGGPEFGYGEGGCLLTNLFLNAPDRGFGRGDPAAYDPEHTPGKPSIQNTPRNKGLTR